MSIQLKVPSLGESVTQATIGAWLKNEGERVQVDEPLVEVESEKATVEVPAPAAGVLKRVLKRTGDTVAVGEAIAELEEGAAGETAAASPQGSGPVPGGLVPVARGDGQAAAPPPAVAATPPRTGAACRGAQSGAAAERRTPSAAERAEAHGRARARCRRGRRVRAGRSGAQGGRGPRARAARGGARPGPRAAAEAARGRRRRARARRADDVAPPHRRAPARRGAADRRDPDHVQRGRHVARARAARAARRVVPREARRQARLHVVLREGGGRGAAAPSPPSTPRSAAPTSSTRTTTTSASPSAAARGSSCRSCATRTRSPSRTSRRRSASSRRRREDNRITMDDLAGGTFTISNGGIYGSLLSTPILNPPQTGILGLHKIEKRAVVRRGRRDRGAADDVPRPLLRPPHRRRARGGAVPRGGQGARSRIPSGSCSRSDAPSRQGCRGGAARTGGPPRPGLPAGTKK